MENGVGQRLTLSTLAATAVLGVVGGISQQSAGYAFKASGGDAWAYRYMVASMDSAAQLFTSPLFVTVACFASGAAALSWVDFVTRKWRSRWQSPERLSFKATDRKLIAMTLMLFFGCLFVLSALWVASERFLGKHPTEIAKVEPQQTTRTSPGQPATERLVKGPYVDWNAQGRLSLQGRFARAGGPFSIYVTYGQTSGFPQPVIGGELAIEPRIKIGALLHFDREEKTNITIGNVTAVEGNQQVIQWGEPSQNNTKVGITWASYFGSIVFVSIDGEEETYPFAIIAKSQEGNPASPVVVGPEILMAGGAFRHEKK